MEDQLFIFDPGTHTCKSPIPTRFEHLLGSVDKIEQYLTIHSQEDIVNINKLLESTLNLQISNIVQRTISQVIGEYGDGFVTIKGTEDGALHVHVTGSEDTFHTVKRAAIWQNTIASFEVIPLVAAKKLCIVNLVFTVDAAADISLNTNDTPITGLMDFGGTGEPKGFVSNHGDFPLKTAAGEAFKIQSSTTARIAGYVIYYEE